MVKTPNIAFSGHTQIDGYCIKKSVWKYLPIPCEMSTSWGWERIIFYVLGGMVLWCCSATQLCPTLCGTMDCSPPDSSVLGISQAGILKWDTMPSSRESSRQRDQTWVSCIVGRRFTIWATREVTPIQLIDLNDLCKSLDSIYASE